MISLLITFWDFLFAYIYILDYYLQIFKLLFTNITFLFTNVYILV